jgi:hypothetical protein
MSSFEKLASLRRFLSVSHLVSSSPNSELRSIGMRNIATFCWPYGKEPSLAEKWSRQSLQTQLNFPRVFWYSYRHLTCLRLSPEFSLSLSLDMTPHTISLAEGSYFFSIECNEKRILHRSGPWIRIAGTWAYIHR